MRTNFVQQASSHIVDRLWRFAAGAIWVTAIGVGGGIYDVNHHLPRGPMYATGDVVCLNDDRGPCADEYRENFQHLDIPVWAKFLKGKRAELLLMAMVFAGIMASTRPNGGYKNDADD